MRVTKLITGCVKKVKNFTQVPMPDSAIKLVNNWGKKYLKEKNQKLEFLNRLRQRFALDNDEYNKLFEEPENPAFPAEFPGIILDQEDGGDPIPDKQEETEEEIVQRAARTTGVRSHGLGQGPFTGVGGGGEIRYMLAMLILRHTQGWKMALTSWMMRTQMWTMKG